MVPISAGDAPVTHHHLRSYTYPPSEQPPASDYCPQFIGRKDLFDASSFSWNCHSCVLSASPPKVHHNPLGIFRDEFGQTTHAQEPSA